MCHHVLQIISHYNSSSNPEITIEKLQKLATTQVEPEFKAKWLCWWNSRSMRRAAYRFLPPDFKEADFNFWLNKATFWTKFVLIFLIQILLHLLYFIIIAIYYSLQLEDRVVKQFNEISGDELDDIDWKASGGIRKPSDHIESWRILLQVKAFQPFLNPATNPPFLKGSIFEDHPGAPLAEKWVFYRYVSIFLSSLIYEVL